MGTALYVRETRELGKPQVSDHEVGRAITAGRCREGARSGQPICEEGSKTHLVC